MKPVLIAGGGIGGLATAIALAERGADVRVFERRSEFGEDGAGIQIGPNGTRILEELGVAADIRPRVAIPECLFARDGTTGRVLARLPLGRWLEERHGAPYWAAHRRDLHAALVKRAAAHPNISFSMDTTVAWLAQVDDETVRIRTGGGAEHEAGGVICADGLWSSLRDNTFYARPLRFGGKVAARAVVSIDQVPETLREMAVNMWLSPGTHVVHYPVRAGHELALIVVFDEDAPSSDWSAPCESEVVKRKTQAFAPHLRELLSRPDSWRKWSLHSLPEVPVPAEGRVALIGDAAHPILPFLAQGAVLALEDAAVLARQYASSRNWERAFASYAATRCQRTARVAKASERNGRAYHLAGAMAHTRNEVLRRLGPERMMKQYDWLYGWTPDRG